MRSSNPEFQSDSVNVGTGSSGDPVISISGQLVGVVANNKNFLEQFEYAAYKILEPDL